MLIPIKLAEGKAEVPKKIQLLKVGTFLHEDGSPIQVTADLLSSLKKNFDVKARGYEDGKLPVDYFHENERIAGGWISGVELSGDGSELWCDVEWTPKAQQMLADGELRYISAEFHPNYRHNEGGKKFGPTLFGAGLTNRPFIKGMKAVAMSEGENEMNLEQALAKIKDLEAKIASMEGSKASDEKAMGEIKKELGESEKKLSEATTKLAEVTKLAEKNEKSAKFDKMLADGKACEAQREHFLSGDMVKFAETAKPLNGKSGHEGGGKDDGETAVAKVEKLAEKIRTDRKVGLRESYSLALSENPEIAKQYEKETAV